MDCKGTDNSCARKEKRKYLYILHILYFLFVLETKVCIFGCESPGVCKRGSAVHYVDPVRKINYFPTKTETVLSRRR